VAAKIIIATILRERGGTGVQSHFNTFRSFLQRVRREVCVITPFRLSPLLVYPIFGVRKIIDPFSGVASVRWYRYWHYLLLKLALRRELADGQPAMIYAQCPLSAKAALEVRDPRRHQVVLVAHFNISQAYEWAEKGKLKPGGAPTVRYSGWRPKPYRGWMVLSIYRNSASSNWSKISLNSTSYGPR
jgi:hypothetical protein